MKNYIDEWQDDLTLTHLRLQTQDSEVIQLGFFLLFLEIILQCTKDLDNVYLSCAAMGNQQYYTFPAL